MWEPPNLDRKSLILNTPTLWNPGDTKGLGKLFTKGDSKATTMSSRVESIT